MHTFEALGTRWSISGDMSASVRGLIEERLSLFDVAYSRFRQDSLVSRMAREKGTYRMPDDFGPLWDVYVRLYESTNGAFSPLVGSVLEDLGYDSQYSLSPKVPRRVSALTSLNWEPPCLTLLEPALLDIGAAGKGYAADLVSGLLHHHGPRIHTVNAGGDIVAKGTTTVGLEDPHDEGKVIGRVAITDESICGSSGNRRRLAHGHHIVDARTRGSPEGILATWVIAKTGLEADALATALYFSAPESLAQSFSFDWAVLLSDRTVRYSERFRGAWFSGLRS